MDPYAMDILVDGKFVGSLQWHDGLGNFRLVISSDGPLVILPFSFLEAVRRQKELIVTQAQAR